MRCERKFFWDCAGIALIVAAGSLVAFALSQRYSPPPADPFPFTAEAEGR